MNRKTYIIYILMFSPFMLMAQNKHQATIVTEANFKPVLPNVKKISERPKILNIEKPEITEDFTILDKDVPVKYQVDTIKPASISKQSLRKLNNLYAKLGIGAYFTPVAKLYYSQGRHRKNSFSAGLEHISSQGPDEFINGGFSSTKLFLNNVYSMTKNMAFTSNAYLDSDVRRTYGKFEITDDKLIQIKRLEYLNLGGFLNLNSKAKDSSKINHQNIIDYNFLKANSARENDLSLKGNANMFYNNNYLLGIEYKADYRNLVNAYTQNGYVFSVAPTASMKYDKFYFEAGIRIGYISTTIDDENESDPHLFPVLNVSYDVIDKIIVPYIKLDGGLSINDLKKTYKKNPFINASEYKFFKTVDKYNFSLGIRGFISNNMYFNVGFKNASYDNGLFFVNKAQKLSNTLENFYYAINDNYQENTFYAELTYNKGEKINVLARGTYSTYTMSKELEAWHKPQLKIDILAKYNLENKVLVRLESSFRGKQYYKFQPTALLPEVREITWNLDLNLGLEYRYSKRLSTFIDFTNILNTKYQIYNNYPTQGIGAIGGFTYSFL